MHPFYNPSPEPVRFRTEIAPGHRGFAQGLILGCGLAGEGRVSSKGIPTSIWHLALIADMTDSRLAGPLRVLNPRRLTRPQASPALHTMAGPPHAPLYPGDPARCA